MKQNDHPPANFALALRIARQARGTTQEQFDLVSSRTYISALERGLKQPTLRKVDQLATVLGLHPLTLLTLSYVLASAEGSPGLDTLIGMVRDETSEVLAANGLE